MHLREDVNVSFGRVKETDPLKFEETLVIFKTKDDIIKAYWDNIGFTFKEKLSQENILFLENYVWIYNFKETAVKNLKKETLTSKIVLEGFSLGDLDNESCILIPKNNLSYIKLFLRDISYILENEFNVVNFKSLLLKTKIIIEISSMDDLTEINKLKECFPEHSELTISYSDTIK